MIHVLLLLCTIPGELPDVYQTMAFHNSTPAYIKLFKEAGVLEEHEVVEGRYFLYPLRFYYDIKTLQMRVVDLQPDTPPFSAASFIPSAEECRSNYLLAGRYRQYLIDKLRFAHPIEREALLDNIFDTELRKVFWEKAYDIKDKIYTSRGRRKDLQMLVDMIGKESYYSLDFPTPLPPSGYEEVWR